MIACYTSASYWHAFVFCSCLPFLPPWLLAEPTKEPVVEETIAPATATTTGNNDGNPAHTAALDAAGGNSHLQLS